MCKTTFAIKVRITLTCSQVKVVRTTTVAVRVLLAAQVALAVAQGLRQVAADQLVPQTVCQVAVVAVQAAALHVPVVVVARVLVTALVAVVNPVPQTAPARVLVVVQVLTDGGLCDQSQDYSKPSRYGRRLHYNRTGKQLYR